MVAILEEEVSVLALVLSQQTATAAQAFRAGTIDYFAVSDEKKPGLLPRLFGRNRNMSV